MFVRRRLSTPLSQSRKYKLRFYRTTRVVFDACSNYRPSSVRPHLRVTFGPRRYHHERCGRCQRPSKKLSPGGNRAEIRILDEAIRKWERAREHGGDFRCTVYIDKKYLAGDYVLYSTELGCTYIYRFLLRDISDLAVPPRCADICIHGRLIVRYGAR